MTKKMQDFAQAASRSPYPFAAPLPGQARHNLILEGSAKIPFYTDMLWVMEMLGWDACRNYHWLANDMELDCGVVLPDDPAVLSGEALERVLRDHPDVQYIWAAFSAVPRHIALADIEVHEAVLPDVQSADFWHGVPVPQHPQAEFEIICWDSSATLFIGLPDVLAQRLIAAFPDCRVLDHAVCRG